MKELLKAAKSVESIKETQRRLKELFKYKTPEEELPGHEVAAGNRLFIEVGGPCCQEKLVILNRSEHTLLADAVYRILNDRLTESESALDKECTKRMNKEEVEN